MPRPGRFPLGKEPRKGCVDPRTGLEKGKTLAPTPVDPRIFRPLVSRPVSAYWAMPAAISTSSFYFSANRLNEKITMSTIFLSEMEPKLCS